MKMDLGALAKSVEEEHALSIDAKRAELDAAAALLRGVVEAVRPALRAVASRIQVREVNEWRGATTFATTEEDFLDGPGGLIVSAAAPGPVRDDNRLRSGRYEGECLFLLPDGTWLELTYDGQWSNWVGAGRWWKAQARAMTDLEVAGAYEVEEIVARIQRAMETAQGSRTTATARMRERAQKLAALATLLGWKGNIG
jgi:hypothetical protein